MASVELLIEQGNPPVAEDDQYQTEEDAPLIVNAEEGVLANDTDPDGGDLFAVLVSGPTHGVLNSTRTARFVYTPDANFVGQDVFMYQASDGALLSNVATVTIDVTPIDDAPVAVDDLYFIEDNGTLMVSADDGVLANDFDVEGDPLSARSRGRTKPRHIGIQRRWFVYL